MLREHLRGKNILVGWYCKKKNIHIFRKLIITDLLMKKSKLSVKHRNTVPRSHSANPQSRLS